MSGCKEMTTQIPILVSIPVTLNVCLVTNDASVGDTYYKEGLPSNGVRFKPDIMRGNILRSNTLPTDGGLA